MLRRRLPVSHPSLVGAIGLVALVALTSCGGDDDPSTASDPTTPAAASAAPTAGATGSTPSLDLADACTLVPSADVADVTGLDVDDGVPDGDERRRVCTFRTADGEVGITVGVEGADRFDDKAATSRRSLGVEGEPVAGLGDAALFFFSDEDLPEGVGGTLVGVGAITVDVTLQGLDEPALRDASTAIAELAVANL